MDRQLGKSGVCEVLASGFIVWAEVIVRIEEDTLWLAESDIAINDAFTRDELVRSSKSPQSNGR